MLSGNEIRQKFLDYFEQQGHRVVSSSPLLPANDPTLLFANAGMNQFKDTFLGAEKRDYVRAATSQKCIRAGGKHNDLDEVGKTARHHTFFEMLGNFSFGDYFKEDAIKLAWDLLVNEFGLDPQRLWFSIFEGDDEVGADEQAAALWASVGAAPERILRFGRKDNFWQMGETGPCGPCSEIHYYMGDESENPAKNRAEFVNGPGDTTMEIWNLVFMQYNRTGVGAQKDGKFESYRLEPLPAPSVDTGLGLERMTAVLQGVQTNYDTDLIKPIIDFTAQLADRHYEPDTKEGFAMRVVADHARTTAFAIADGIMPGNSDRNYVLRKIMRRAIYHGRQTLGFEDVFFAQVTDFVAGQMRDAYPELEQQRGFIEKMVTLEEQRFATTLTVGLKKLAELFALTPEGQTPEYKDLARLYDTFGTPRDLIRVSLEERGQVIGEEEFNSAFDAAMQKLQQAGAHAAGAAAAKANPLYAALAGRAGKSVFKGYETTRVEKCKVTALLKDGVEVKSLEEGEDGEVVLDQTPFYAEAGGQVGDTGNLSNIFTMERWLKDPPPSITDTLVTVNDTYSQASGLIVHRVKVERSNLWLGDEVTATVDAEKRDATRRNHTATHLLHAALREVLGTHVKQAGSVVAPHYLRFDFSHYQPLSKEEVVELERLVNLHIIRNAPVNTDLMAIEEAMRAGAMALFGEKYGANVRVLSVGDGQFSRELCGGTHVRATGDIGLLKITSDESIASGTRRIRALTGADAFALFQETWERETELAQRFRTAPANVPSFVDKLQEDLKKAHKEADELKLKLAMGGGVSANNNEVREVSGVKVLAREASGLDINGVRQLSDTLLRNIKSGVVVIGRAAEGKVSLIVRSSDDVKGRVPAGQVISQLAPLVGGRGGGRPDMAEGGGSQPEKLNEALAASYGIVEKLLG